MTNALRTIYMYSIYCMEPLSKASGNLVVLDEIDNGVEGRAAFQHLLRYFLSGTLHTHIHASKDKVRMT